MKTRREPAARSPAVHRMELWGVSGSGGDGLEDLCQRLLDRAALGCSVQPSDLLPLLEEDDGGHPRDPLRPDRWISEETFRQGLEFGLQRLIVRRLERLHQPGYPRFAVAAPAPEINLDVGLASVLAQEGHRGLVRLIVFDPRLVVGIVGDDPFQRLGPHQWGSRTQPDLAPFRLEDDLPAGGLVARNGIGGGPLHAHVPFRVPDDVFLGDVPDGLIRPTDDDWKPEAAPE